jgi:translation initiation factor IF-1
MNLRLAIVLSCGETGARIQFLEDGESVETRHSRLVQAHNIRILPDELVAVDMDPEPPEIVWRWLRGTVDKFEGDRVVVKVTDHPCTLASVARVDEFDLPLEIGAGVWCTSTPDDLAIHDLIHEGKPTQPKRLLAHHRSVIEAVYGVPGA